MLTWLSCLFLLTTGTVLGVYLREKEVLYWRHIRIAANALWQAVIWAFDRTRKVINYGRRTSSNRGEHDSDTGGTTAVGAVSSNGTPKKRAVPTRRKASSKQDAPGGGHQAARSTSDLSE